jgi:protein ImuA
MPGVAFPRWRVELLRIRGGQPGKWELEWRQGKFHPIAVSKSYLTEASVPVLAEEQRRKTG